MTALLVPYYEHPSARPADWEALIAAAPRLYGVVLNPAGGPGPRPDPAYAAVAARLRAAGVRVLGYTDTGHGRRPVGDVLRDLAYHRAWYAVDGVLLDRAAADPHRFPHYRRLACAARAAGCATVALNPGTPPHPCYAEIADVLITFEGPWTAYRHLQGPPWYGPAGPLTCHLVHGTPPGADAGALSRARGAALHCAAPGTGTRPWGALPEAVARVPGARGRAGTRLRPADPTGHDAPAATRDGSPATVPGPPRPPRR
ncbi:spherulation-specific family 4 protein [Streptomyces sp. NPDC047000]|uniref:spherulation-specific family 4 protein n=1 Tax=Streptomyces sp. NPDC047000 TaxID=3155474 RepID=UPI0033F7B4D6